ncbi:FAD-dependent oxidoreductase [Phototrophicus methaneseepsis]|uniref:FAD-dependent oxidoreductase n=1 Tax=Phototrophicus methaneseepsis TaxID=2710758 RepID=A0A7S8EAH0_9CHLR|nr:FAD-dependent oxidoreductase [Phototrophicus methaneseepsis]QPC83345.1 FAD-dependent oxidoreductase [Phototrophicus methaneseepsis]
MKEKQTDILIIGGGLGGVAAALAAAKLGKKVIMTEETDWIGGQLTAQGVPPDEHPWVDSTGSTPTYRLLREGIRDYYRNYYPMRPEVRDDSLLNPGNGFVSRLCHEPRAGLAVLEGMLAPYRSSLQIEILLEHVPVAVETDGDHFRSVTVVNKRTEEQVVLHAPYIIDATELGDLLELGNVEHVIGAESQSQTGELHALPGDANPMDQQAISWCFAMDYLPGEDHTIDKPEDYDFWQSYQADFWPGKQLSWYDVNPFTLQPRYQAIFESDNTTWNNRVGNSFWFYRRIFDRCQYVDGAFPSDITMVNWPQIDYWLGPIVGVSEEEKQKNLRASQQLSLSLLYWMQTEAPRHDGGNGYPGLRLRGDVLGSDDGLAKYVYVRESRRIQAEFTVLEQHVGVKAREGLVGAERFADSVGLGSYRIDLHPSTAPRTYIDISSYPFQVPLGALIPVRVENMLPACKNIGTTHITNGCYRLHPVEWAIGEAVGTLAAYCLEKDLTPRQVRNDEAHLQDFQSVLTRYPGYDLEWPEYARITAR